MPLIELRDVDKVYELGEVSVEALRGACLTVDHGEYIALIGPSGSGKSTLMNIVGCLDQPTRGSYRLDDVDVSTLSRDQRAEIRNQQIGFVFQNFNLLARTPAIENVELPLLYFNDASTNRRKRAAELLDRVGVGDRAAHYPSQLSGGQQQRVAIARALVNDPSILLADEPTGNLDSQTSREVLKLFSQLNQDGGLTIILVTHEQEVARHARRWVVLHDGRIVVDTTDFQVAMESLHPRDQELDDAGDLDEAGDDSDAGNDRRNPI